MGWQKHDMPFIAAFAPSFYMGPLCYGKGFFSILIH